MLAARVRTASPAEALREALARLDAGERVVIATVLRRRGSAPGTPGQKLALFLDGNAVGTVGGGAVEKQVLDDLGRMLDEHGAEPRTAQYELGASMGMCCGGAVEILFEPMAASVSVLVVGAGHVGGALAPILCGLGFKVLVVDAREDAFEARGLSASSRLELFATDHDDPDILAALGEPSRAFAVVMTHDHQLDQQVIEWALGRGFGFVGGVGSRAKALKTRQRLEGRSFSVEDIERVRMPLGVSIEARSPGEIAVAIAAELVAVRARWLGRDRGAKSVAT